MNELQLKGLEILFGKFINRKITSKDWLNLTKDISSILNIDLEFPYTKKPIKPFRYFDESFKDHFIDDVGKITFNNLYGHIINNHQTENPYNQIYKKVYEFRKFVTTSKDEDLLKLKNVLKFYLNFYYGMCLEDFSYIAKEIENKYSKLIEYSKKDKSFKIISINIDELYFVGDLPLDIVNDLHWDYFTDYCGNGIFFTDYKYITFKGAEEIRLKGVKIF